MKSGLILSVIEITGNSACITAENGQRVYQRIVAAMNKNQIIELSFNNIRYMTPAFLNAAIGQLYSVFDQEVICSRLKIKDIETINLELLKRVTENAKEYFKVIKLRQALAARRN